MPGLTTTIGAYIYFVYVKAEPMNNDSGYLELIGMIELIWCLITFCVRRGHLTYRSPEVDISSLTIGFLLYGWGIYALWPIFSWTLLLLITVYGATAGLGGYLRFTDQISLLFGHIYFLSVLFAYVIQGQYLHSFFLYIAPLAFVVMALTILAGLLDLPQFIKHAATNFSSVMGKNDSILLYMLFMLSAFAFNLIEGLLTAYMYIYIYIYRMLTPLVMFPFFIILSYILMNEDSKLAYKISYIFAGIYGTLYHVIHIYPIATIITNNL